MRLTKKTRRLLIASVTAAAICVCLYVGITYVHPQYCLWKFKHSIMEAQTPGGRLAATVDLLQYLKSQGQLDEIDIHSASNALCIGSRTPVRIIDLETLLPDIGSRTNGVTMSVDFGVAGSLDLYFAKPALRLAGWDTRPYIKIRL